jgi:hypothetical protein
MPRGFNVFSGRPREGDDETRLYKLKLRVNTVDRILEFMSRLLYTRKQRIGFIRLKSFYPLSISLMETAHHFYSLRVHGFSVGKNFSIALCGKRSPVSLSTGDWGLNFRLQKTDEKQKRVS